jgi:hypothetical protein
MLWFYKVGLNLFGHTLGILGLRDLMTENLYSL